MSVAVYMSSCGYEYVYTQGGVCVCQVLHAPGHSSCDDQGFTREFQFEQENVWEHKIVQETAENRIFSSKLYGKPRNPRRK